jgi:hypothetical protein
MGQLKSTPGMQARRANGAGRRIDEHVRAQMAEGFIVTSSGRAARVAAVAAGATSANGTRLRQAADHRPAKLSAFGRCAGG